MQKKMSVFRVITMPAALKVVVRKFSLRYYLRRISPIDIAEVEGF